MELALTTVTAIDFILLIIVSIAAVRFIKCQSYIRYNHFMYRKRRKLLCHFKALYGSYSHYRSTFRLGSEELLKDKQLVKLLQNDYLGKSGSCLNPLENRDSYLLFREMLQQLDLLSEDIKVFYKREEAQVMQDFIFWYRMVLSELGSVKKGAEKGKILKPLRHRTLLAEVKNLERCYQALQENNLIRSLESKIEIH